MNKVRVRIRKECFLKGWIGYIVGSNCNGTFRVRVFAYLPRQIEYLGGADIYINLLPEEVEPC